MSSSKRSRSREMASDIDYGGAQRHQTRERRHLAHEREERGPETQEMGLGVR